MDTTTIAIIAALFGVIARVFVPWLIARIKNPDNGASQFTWRYVWPQLLLVLVLVLVAPLVSDVSLLMNASPLVAYLAGWGAADLGKTIFLDGGEIAGLIKKPQ